MARHERRLLGELRARAGFHVSPLVVSEVGKALREKLSEPASGLPESATRLWQGAVLVSDQAGQGPPARLDVADRQILQAAVGARMDSFVTGDRALLHLRHLGETNIVRPAHALRILGLTPARPAKPL